MGTFRYHSTWISKYSSGKNKQMISIMFCVSAISNNEVSNFINTNFLLSLFETKMSKESIFRDQFEIRILPELTACPVENRAIEVKV